MKTRDVIKHFGSRAKAAEALGFARPSAYRWGETMPEVAAWRAQYASGGKLRMDVERYYVNLNGRKRA